MNYSQFDDFFNESLRDYAVPVPKNLWEKVSEGQFDQFIGNTLRESEAPVPEGLWDRISDAQFDNFIGNTLAPAEAPVPDGLWDRISEGQFDEHVANTFENTESPVPASVWDNIAGHQFDEGIAGKLKDHESPVPEGLWEKVRPAEEDDRRPVVFWFRYPGVAAILIGVLVAAGLGYFLFRNKGNQLGTENAVSANAADGKRAHNATGTNVQPAGNQAGLQSSEGNATTPAAPAQKPSAAPTENTVHPDGASTTITSLSSPQNNPTAHAATADAHLLTNNIRRGGFNLAPPPARSGADVTRNSYDPFSAGTAPISQVTAAGEPSKDLADVIGDYQPHTLQAGSTIPFSLSYHMIDKQLPTLNHTNQFRSVIICPTDRRVNTDWFLEAYASPDIALRSVTNVSASQLYMLKKDSAESMRVGFTAGIRVVKPLNDNILLKAGVQYTQANQNYTYRTENEVKTTTVVTQRTIIRGPGDTVLVSDTSVLQTAGYRTNTVKNRFRTIDVPLTVGYQFGDDDLKFGINAGVVFNLTSWYQGVILDTSLATVTLGKSGNGVYKTHLGLGLVGSISVVKKLSDDMYIFAEPYFRYNLSNMTTPQANFTQRLSLGGLSVGLRFNLSRK